MVIWILFIWSRSLEPSVESAQASGYAMNLINGLLEKLSFGIDVSEHFIRKIAHFTEYTILGLLVANALKVFSVKEQFLGAFGCLLVAMCDESIQLFVEGRSGQVSDVWLDFAGALTGLLLYNVIKKFAAKRAQEKESFNEKKNCNCIGT